MSPYTPFKYPPWRQASSSFSSLKRRVSGITFPNPNWVLEQKVGTIIFCSTTAKHANNLVIGQRSKAPRTSLLDPQRRTQQNDEVNWADYGTDVLTIFRKDPDLHHRWDRCLGDWYWPPQCSWRHCPASQTSWWDSSEDWAMVGQDETVNASSIIIIYVTKKVMGFGSIVI